jgi:hypothetical protein
MNKENLFQDALSLYLFMHADTPINFGPEKETINPLKTKRICFI